MKRISKFVTENVAFVGLVLVVVLGAALSSTFLTGENLTNILRSASIMGCVAVGMMFVILCGSIDLSVSSVFALSGYLFIEFSDKSILLALIMPLVAGIAVGLFNGFLISKLNIPPFVGTLASMMFVRGIVLLLTNETTIKPNSELSTFLKFIGRGAFAKFITIPLVIFVIITLIAAYVLNKRPLGRAMYIVGGNTEAARMMGVSVSKTLFSAHTICGGLAALGGIVLASRVGSATPLAGNGYELYAIAAVVLGGARLSGGIGKISGTFIGTLIMGSFTNIFNLQRILNAVWEQVLVGGILLLVIVMQAIGSKIGSVSNKKTKKAGGF